MKLVRWWLVWAVFAAMAAVGLGMLFSRLDRRCRDHVKETTHVDCDRACREQGRAHPEECDCSALCGCHR